MSKYIIEIDDDLSFDVQFLQAIGAEPNGVVRIRHIEFENLEELNSDYINEHFGDLQDTAYKKGLEEGKKATWEAVRKVIHLPEGVVLDLFTDCYSSVCTVLQVFLKYEGSEVIEKLKAYEEKQKADGEIRVGDEVEISQSDANGIWVVIKVEKHDGYEAYCAINKDGDIYFEEEQDRVTKTGRHFDIESILEDMRE